MDRIRPYNDACPFERRPSCRKVVHPARSSAQPRAYSPAQPSPGTAQGAAGRAGVCKRVRAPSRLQLHPRPRAASSRLHPWRRHPRTRGSRLRRHTCGRSASCHLSARVA